MKNLTWVVVGIVLLLVLGASAPKLTGWLLILIVLGALVTHARTLS